MNEILWVVFPYVCLTVFVVGHFWRYRYDKFGWTTRSSQLYEDRLLRWGSPLFHFGILAVFLGHVMGLGVPKSWTEAVGISEGLYHFLAVSIGAIAGFGTVVGLAILIYRRRTVGPVFSATTRMDKVMYLFLATVILLGLVNTVAANIFGHYDYREGVSVWFRGIFRFDLHPDLMAEAPLTFQLHGLVAIALFALWPFTRLVHVFSAPLGYLTRPYIVYRSRDRQLSGHSPRRGWAPAPRRSGAMMRRSTQPPVRKRSGRGRRISNQVSPRIGSGHSHGQPERVRLSPRQWTNMPRATATPIQPPISVRPACTASAAVVPGNAVPLMDQAVAPRTRMITQSPSTSAARTRPVTATARTAHLPRSPAPAASMPSRIAATSVWVAWRCLPVLSSSRGPLVTLYRTPEKARMALETMRVIGPNNLEAFAPG